MAVELKDLAPLLLKKERASGDIDVPQLTAVLRGGLEENARRTRLVQIAETHPVLSDREYHYRNHTERYNYGIKKIHSFVKVVRDQKITDKTEQQYLHGALGEPLPIDVHHAMFIPTLEYQADDELQKQYLPRAHNYEIFGAYAQTELGHGSNIQGMETTAHFDKQAQEFVIHSPTLTSRKWWPGALGKTATHAIVHARLILEGKDVGVQAFLVQLRSLETHAPLPGIEVGDIGPKVGFNAIDNGYAAFHNVRIPRSHMMMRHAKVLPDGSFVKPKSDKLVYLTMVNVRAYLIVNYGRVLGQATTITTRFSAARVQGRTPDGKGEFQVLDYQNQQDALFTAIALSFAAHFAGGTLHTLHDAAMDVISSGGASFGRKLAELHCVSSGLKAWLAENVSNAIESCRRLCGSHGFTQASNLAHLFSEAVGSATYEGTFDVLVQQHARYLVKMLVETMYKDTEQLTDTHKTDDTMTRFLERIKQHADPSSRCEAERASDFLDFSVIVPLFETRTTRAIIRLAKELQATDGDLNKCMVLMTRASLAHSELVLVTSFVDGVQSVPAGSTRDAMSSLCSLFALSLIVRSLGDFREDNYLSSTQAECVRQQLLALLLVVRRNAVLVTDAWDFSDFELNSAIGRYDGDIYRALVKRTADEPLNKTQVAESYEPFLKPLIRAGL